MDVNFSAPSATGLENSALINGVHKNGAIAPQPSSIKGAPLDASKLQVTRSTSLREVPEANSPEIIETSICTDHMMTVRWTVTKGWESPQIIPSGPLSIPPTASCLHYATQCFEGMKVYRGYDGKLRLFRPDRNCERMVVSSLRVSLPPFETRELEKLMKALLSIDGPRWLPKNRQGQSLYVRPTIIANGAQIGVRLPAEALLFVVVVPWADLPIQVQKEGLKLIASKADVTRAWPGGFGHAKVGANYGPSFHALGEAREQGFDQVLWLFGDECLVTEAGASNFFVVWKSKEIGRLELVTAPLDEKIILPGVTRRSVLDLAISRLSKIGNKSNVDHLDVVERTYSMFEIAEAAHDGRLVEAFVSGTAVSRDRRIIADAPLLTFL